jgi:thioredoxin 1
MNMGRTVLLDFYADWCAPCRRVSPLLAKLAREFEGKIRLVRVNVDTESVRVDKYEVYSLPTVVLVLNGREIERIIGAKSKEHYRAAIIRTLKKSKDAKS